MIKILILKTTDFPLLRIMFYSTLVLISMREKNVQLLKELLKEGKIKGFL